MRTRRAAKRAGGVQEKASRRARARCEPSLWPGVPIGNLAPAAPSHKIRRRSWRKMSKSYSSRNDNCIGLPK